MGKGKKKAAAAAGGAASAGPVATATSTAPPKKAGWEGITLKKKKKPAAAAAASSSTGRRPLNTAAGAVSGSTGATGSTSVGNTTNSSRRGADSGSSSGTVGGGSGDAPSASVARKVHALPNFKAQLRDLAATIPQNAPPQPGLALKRFATVFAHVPLKKPSATATEELALSRDSCKLLLTELGLFRPPRVYVTLGGYEIAWLRASSVNGGAGGGAAARVLSLSAFKTALVPGLAAALKPQKQSADELWSRLCLDAALRLTEMRPKQKQKQQQQRSRNDADADRVPQPTPVQRGAGRGPGAAASFAGRAKLAAAAADAGGGKGGGGGKRGKKGKKMSIQDFQAERLRQQRTAQAQAMAQVRQRAQQQPPGQAGSSGGAADSLKDIMEREARLQLYQERQEAAARAKAATAQEQLHGKRLARRRQVWGNPGAPPPTGVLADGGANLRAVMAREAALKQARGAHHQQPQFVPQRQAAHRKPGGLYGGPVANRWGVPKGSDAAVPTLREIQERERRARELQQRRRQLEQAGGTASGSGSPSSGDAGRPLGEGGDAVAGAWQFEDAAPGTDEYYYEDGDGDGGRGDMWDGETRRVAGVAEEEALPDDKAFWDLDD